MPTPAEVIAKLKTELDNANKYYNDELVKLRGKAAPLKTSIDASKVDKLAIEIEKLRVALGTNIVAIEGMVKTTFPEALKKFDAPIGELKKDYREFGGAVA
jgi:hypothetical protein